MMDDHDAIPQGRLSDEARARRRAELLEAVAADRTTSGRGRWLVPVAAAAAVAVVGGGIYLAADTGGDGAGPGAQESSLDVAGSDDDRGSPSPSVKPSGSARTCDPQAVPGRNAIPSWEDPQLAPVLASYRDILADHLDPGGRHLDRKVTNVQTGMRGGCDVTALGTKLGWTVPGQEGMGMVQVEVTDLEHGRQLTQIHLAHGGWRKVPVAGLPAAVVAYAVEYDGGIAVSVTREDDLTVAIDANSLFGNNSTVPVAGLDLTVDDLLATAADTAFRMP